jgi:hypothetical protein
MKTRVCARNRGCHVCLLMALNVTFRGAEIRQRLGEKQTLRDRRESVARALSGLRQRHSELTLVPKRAATSSILRASSSGVKMDFSNRMIEKATIHRS